MPSLKRQLENIRACRICEKDLLLGPRPVLSCHKQSRIAIVGQAPGTRVHKSGVPWDDPSGVRLRDWLQVGEKEFYDPKIFAIIPMGFCYPGKGKSGDLPPRPECAPTWHEDLFALLPNIELTLLIGQYAQKYYLGDKRKRTLTETVQNYKEYLPDYLPLVHPSPRNAIWMKKNPWFEKKTVPKMRAIVKNLLD